MKIEQSEWLSLVGDLQTGLIKAVCKNCNKELAGVSVSFLLATKLDILEILVQDWNEHVRVDHQVK